MSQKTVHAFSDNMATREFSESLSSLGLDSLSLSEKEADDSSMSSAMPAKLHESFPSQSCKVKFYKLNKHDIYADFETGYGEKRDLRMRKEVSRTPDTTRMPSVEEQQLAILKSRRARPKNNLR
jgi:hypothetical protein